MNESINKELREHVLDLIAEGAINADNIDDAHNIAFNEDYYVIGYYQADQWLLSHDVSPWEAIAYVNDKDIEIFGESELKPEDINSERIVNLLVYYAGMDIDIASMLEESKQ